MNWLEPIRLREWRAIAVFGFDLVAVVLAWFFAFQLRFDFAPPTEQIQLMLRVLLLLLPLEVLLFRTTGLYRGIWAFSSLPDLARILKAVIFSALALIALATFLAPEPAIPRAVLVVYPMLLVLLMGGGRAAYRMWKEHRLYGALHQQGTPVLVLGAGRAGANLVQELARSREWRVIGLLDDDPSKLQREIHGQRVLGPLSELSFWANRLGVQHVILAIPSLPEELRQRIGSLCVQAGVRTYTVPSTEQLLLERDRLDHVRPIDLQDLLGRAQI